MTGVLRLLDKLITRFDVDCSLLIQLIIRFNIYWVNIGIVNIDSVNMDRLFLYGLDNCDNRLVEIMNERL